MTPCMRHPWPRKWLRIAPRSLSEWSMVVSFGTCRAASPHRAASCPLIAKKISKKKMTAARRGPLSDQSQKPYYTPTLVWRVDIKHGYTVWIYIYIYGCLNRSRAAYIHSFANCCGHQRKALECHCRGLNTINVLLLNINQWQQCRQYLWNELF